MRITATASTIAIGIALFATPAFAQDPTPLGELVRRSELAREIETILSEADRAQKAGQCQTRNALLLTLKTTIESQRAAAMPDAAKEEWRQRGQEILNRRCPPAAAAPQPPAPSTAGPDAPASGESVMDAMGESAPNRSSLDVLKERMDAQIAECDDLKAYGDAKRDLLAEIERRMGMEKDPSMQIELRELYRRYATRLPPTCTPRRVDKPAGAAPEARKDPYADVPIEIRAKVFLDLLYGSRYRQFRGGMPPSPPSEPMPVEEPGKPVPGPPKDLDPPRY